MNQNITVTKSTTELYQVRNGHEWASISVREFSSRVPTGRERPYYGGEIMINSSFGSWANSWGACGSPFKQFLQDIEFDYAFGKFMGASLMVFDDDKTIKAMKEKLIEARREQSIDKEDARDLWRRIDDIDAYSEEGFITSCQAIASDFGPRYPLREIFSEPWDYVERSPDIQATGFWEKIWPHFIATLKQEQQDQGT